jgi:hypothetical protein
MSFISDNLTGASQLAVMLAERSGPGFSKDPGDYRPAKVKLSGAVFNRADPAYRSDLPADGLLIGNVAITPEGVPIIFLGSLSGWQEKDRVVIDGRETTRLFAIWRHQPEVEYLKGRGGGKKTDRGGWITGKYDEIFLLTPYGLAVLTLFDMHHVVAELNQRAASHGVGAMYEIKWQLTKKAAPDGDYTKYEPSFEPLSVAGEPNGPSDAQIAQAKKLTPLISHLSYQNPDIPLRLVVNSAPVGEPPAPPPPPGGEDDYGVERDDDLPKYLK